MKLYHLIVTDQLGEECDYYRILCDESSVCLTLQGVRPSSAPWHLFVSNFVFWLFVCCCLFHSIMPMLAGHDMIVQAQSGTGKTAIFCIAALQAIDLSRNQCQALIVVPA